MRILLMGVSGAGKSTVGPLLAKALGARYIEGDDFHPRTNVESMGAGVSLNDNSRLTWLLALAAELRQAAHRDEPVVLGCSALKESYRRLLLADCPGCRIVWLHGSRSMLEDRLTKRADHFMPAHLLPSQYADLEIPTNAIAVDVTASPEQIVTDLTTALFENNETKQVIDPK